MIDEFVQVVYEKKAEDDRIAKLAADMEKLPIGELKKIASYGLGGYGDPKEWLCKYKGTPLFEQAVALEQQNLQLEGQENQWQAEDQLRWRAKDQVRAAQDQLCLQKKMLDLELATLKNAQELEEQSVEWEEEMPVEAPEAIKQAGARMRNRLMQKQALSVGTIANIAGKGLSRAGRAVSGGVGAVRKAAPGTRMATAREKGLGAVSAAGEWVKKNPAAAGMIGVGGLGAAGAAGAAGYGAFRNQK